MKPNGKKFAVRVVLFSVCAVGLFSGLAGAETVHGTFKLPVAAHWGKMELQPGEYEFVVDTSSATRVVTVTSKATGWSGMILASAVDESRISSPSTMKLSKSENATYIKTLYLKDAGVSLEFSVPGALIRLAKAGSSTMASASGLH